MVVFAQHYEYYLLERSFIIRTDHASLTWLMQFKKIGGQLCRWLEYLARFSYAIQHHSRVKHSNADGLSRIPHEVTCDYYESGKEVQSHPCGGCKYCTKMAADWIRYEEEVDDVLPLSMSHNFLLTARVPNRSRDAEPGVIEPQGVSDLKAEFRDTPENPEITEVDAQIRVVSMRAPPETQESNFIQQYTPEELRQLQMKMRILDCLFVGWSLRRDLENQMYFCKVQACGILALQVTVEAQARSLILHLGRRQVSSMAPGGTYRFEGIIVTAVS